MESPQFQPHNPKRPHKRIAKTTEITKTKKLKN